MDKGWKLPPATHGMDTAVQPLKKMRAAAGYRPKASKPFPVPASCISSLDVLPVESQLLRNTPLQLNGADQCSNPASEQGNDLEMISSSNALVGQQAWGIPFTPMEFVAEAVKKGHPKSFSSALPEVLIHAVEANFRKNHESLIGERAFWFRKWLRISSQLQAEEDSLKQSMPKHMAVILKPKRLALCKATFEDLRYVDTAVVDGVCKGVER